MKLNTELNTCSSLGLKRRLGVKTLPKIRENHEGSQSCNQRSGGIHSSTSLLTLTNQLCGFSGWYVVLILSNLMFVRLLAPHKDTSVVFVTFLQSTVSLYWAELPSHLQQSRECHRSNRLGKEGRETRRKHSSAEGESAAWLFISRELMEVKSKKHHALNPFCHQGAFPVG